MLLLFRKGLCAVAAALMFACAGVQAADHHIDNASDLKRLAKRAKHGDTLYIKPGVYKTDVLITKSLKIIGEGEVVIEGDGKGSTVTVRRSGVELDNITVRGYGSDLYKRDSGVRVMDGAENVKLRNLTIKGPGFGIRADRLSNILIENCRIEGDPKMHVLDRGDGVFLNYVKKPVLRGNSAMNVRDGFYFENVEDSTMSGNYFTGAQYGIHWMYTRRSSAADNRAAGVRGGYAIMSSKDVVLTDSTTSRNIEFGVLLNEADGCLVKNIEIDTVHNPKGNPALDNEGKGIFIYGVGKNRVTENRIAGSDIGIGVAMGGEGNEIWKNAFLDNRLQVRYVGETPLEWSRNGVGNFWSTYMGWDVDSNGIGEKPYQPNDSLDRIFWIYPEARFLMDSPVVALLRWLTMQFEIDRGKGVTDSYPLMRDPTAK